MRTGKVNQKGLSSRRRNEKGRPAQTAAPPPTAGAGWRLPSGEGLTEFALSAGFLAPFLLDGNELEKDSPSPIRKRTESSEPIGASSLGGRR